MRADRGIGRLCHPDFRIHSCEVAELIGYEQCGLEPLCGAFTVCKFIGIPWHQLLHSTPPRARVLGNFRKENSRSE